MRRQPTSLYITLFLLSPPPNSLFLSLPFLSLSLFSPTALEKCDSTSPPRDSRSDYLPGNRAAVKRVPANPPGFFFFFFFFPLKTSSRLYPNLPN